jgi:hypothetical protein
LKRRDLRASPGCGKKRKWPRRLNPGYFTPRLKILPNFVQIEMPPGKDLERFSHRLIACVEKVVGAFLSGESAKASAMAFQL